MFNSKLKKQLQEKDNKIMILESEVSLLKQADAENKQLKIENAEATKKYNDLVGKLREQNEADLFLVSAKIQKGIMEGKSKTDLADLYKTQGQLQSFQQQLLNMYCHPFAQRSAFFSGLGNLW